MSKQHRPERTAATQARGPADHGDALRAAGLRRTPVRLATLAALHDLGHPVSHAQLRAHPALQDADPVTLYRTLAALDDAGLVHPVLGPDGATRYGPVPADAQGCPGNHAHFLCTDCGRMTCLADQPMPWVRPPDGAEVHQRRLVASGVCAACRTRTAS